MIGSQAVSALGIAGGLAIPAVVFLFGRIRTPSRNLRAYLLVHAVVIGAVSMWSEHLQNRLFSSQTPYLDQRWISTTLWGLTFAFWTLVVAAVLVSVWGLVRGVKWAAFPLLFWSAILVFTCMVVLSGYSGFQPIG